MTTSREPSARAVEHAPDPHRLFVTVQKDRARETAFTTPERGPDLLNVTNPQTGPGEGIQALRPPPARRTIGSAHPAVPDAEKALV